MSNGTKEIEKSSAQPGNGKKSVFELTTDIIVFGYMAAWYAGSGVTPRPAMPGWGTEYKHKMIVVKNNAYTATITTRNRVVGMMITEHSGHNAGGGPKRTGWIPLASFAKATLLVEGEWL